MDEGASETPFSYSLKWNRQSVARRARHGYARISYEQDHPNSDPAERNQSLVRYSASWSNVPFQP
jgi:hypothetical protein